MLEDLDFYWVHEKVVKNYMPELHAFSSCLAFILRGLHWLHAEVYVHANQCMESFVLYWQSAVASLPQDENCGGFVGASPCAKAAPDLHMDECPLFSNAALPWDAEIELSGGGSWHRTRCLAQLCGGMEIRGWEAAGCSVGSWGWLLLMVKYPAVVSLKWRISKPVSSTRTN